MNTSYTSCHNDKNANKKGHETTDNISGDVPRYKRKQVGCSVIVILLVLSSSYLFSYCMSPLYGHLLSVDHDHHSYYYTNYSRQSDKVQHLGHATYNPKYQPFDTTDIYPLSYRLSLSGSRAPTTFLQNNNSGSLPSNSSAPSSPRIDVTSLPSSTSLSTNASPPLLRIAAGKIEDLSFTINSNNNNNSPTTTLGGSSTRSITDLSITLVSQSNSVRILGKSQWNLPILNPQSQQVLSTKVFASTPLIGSPVFFSITAQYISNGQELKTESFSLGAIVVGDIKVSVNNLNIRYFGDTPNLVGNLLDEGNTPALFTNIEMLTSTSSSSTNNGHHYFMPTDRSSPSQPSISNDNYTKGENMDSNNLTSSIFKVALRPLSSQYIGNLPVNNPIPFNIPLQIINTNHTQGSPIARSAIGADFIDTVYPLSLKLTYTNDLKEKRELILNKTVSIQPVIAMLGYTVTTNNGQSLNGSRERLNQTREQQQQEPPATGVISPVNNGFVDAYWADRSTALTTSTTNNTVSSASALTSTSQLPPLAKEVGPGEGNSVLAVVLSNTGVSDITGVIGYLTLPHGFSSIIPGGSLPMTTSPRSNGANLNNENQPAIASLNGIVKAGQTYTFYFKVNVLETARVGLHKASLQISYFRVPEPEAGTYRTQTISVPFMLPGKVILDAISLTNDLSPGEVNNITINLKNKGTADASSVVATIARTGDSIVTEGKANFGQPSNSNTNIHNNTSSRDGNANNTMINSQPKPSSSSSSGRTALNLGARAFNIGTIPFNKSANISTAIYPSNSAGGTLQNLDLDITYSDANGITRSTMISLGLRIAPTPPEAGISITPSSYSPLSTPPIITANSGLDYGIRTSDKYVTGHLIPVSILKTTGNSVKINSSTTNNHLTIVAGKVDDLTFDLNNNNNRPITDVVIGLTSETGSMKILGSSKWSLDKINPHGSNQFLTRVFASKSLIGTPVSFTISVRYIYNEQAKSDSFNLGANVVGDIRVAVNDLDINFIGGTPNLVGNLLNRGNTMALFTTVQIMNPSEDKLQKPANNTLPNTESSNNIKDKRVLIPVSSSPQYLGDLQDNSPLPFSIPLALDNSSARGTYPVALKITYSDDLKNTHAVLLNGTVRFNPHIQTSSSNNSSVYGILIPIIIMALLATVAVFVLKRIKKRTPKGEGDRASGQKKNLTRSNEGYGVDTDIARSDIETLLDTGQLKASSEDDKIKDE